MVNKDVNPSMVASFDLDKHIKDYEEEYKLPKPNYGPDIPEQDRMNPSDHKQNILDKLKDIYETTACYDCPLKLMCNRRTWDVGCEFAKVIGCDLHPDQARFPGHSTTVDLTDTTLSALLATGYQATWAGARDLTSGSHDHTTIMFQATRDPALGYAISRGALLFDASSIPATAYLWAVKFQLWSVALGANTHGIIEDGSPTYPSNPIVDADLDRTKYSGQYGSVLGSDMPTGAYRDFYFVNFSKVNRGGTTRHILFEYEHDVANTAPGSSTNYYVLCEGPTHAGGHDPKMTITYDAGGSGVSRSRSVNAGGR